MGVSNSSTNYSEDEAALPIGFRFLMEDSLCLQKISLFKMILKADVEVQYYFNKGRITHVPDHIYFDAKKLKI